MQARPPKRELGKHHLMLHVADRSRRLLINELPTALTNTASLPDDVVHAVNIVKASWRADVDGKKNIAYISFPTIE